jgi:hypothetical protein
VAEVRGIGFAGKSAHRTGRFLLLGLNSVLALAFLAHAQARPAPGKNPPGKDRGPVSAVSLLPAAPAAVPAATDPAPASDPAPATPQTAEQVPAQPPVVTWESNLLTIDAENSTLTAILVAVRTRTGASMEIPAAASAQRVFVHLGPGPVRDVLSSLLYGTGFDYIVETAEDNPDALRSVVLTAQGKGDDSAGSLAYNAGGGSSAVAGNVPRGAAAEAAAHREAGMRLMPGWAGPGKPAFQADAEAALAAKEAASQESGSALDGRDATAANPPPTGTESAAAGQEANGNGSQPAAPPSASAGSSTEGELSPATTAQADAASAPASDSDDQTGVSHMIRDMTHMFEQRRQIQAQQNQAGQRPNPN